mgnify:CR=1 FL=1
MARFQEITASVSKYYLYGSSWIQYSTRTAFNNQTTALRFKTASNNPFYLSYRTYNKGKGWLPYVSSTNANDVQVSWIYNGRDDIASISSVGLLCRELSVALRLHNKSNLHDIFTEIHQQVQNGIKYSCYPYMATIPQDEEGDIACVLYQRDIREADDFDGMNVNKVEIAHNNAAAQSVLDIQILDGEDGLQYVFDYTVGQYKQETMSEFQNLFKRVVAADFDVQHQMIR